MKGINIGKNALFFIISFVGAIVLTTALLIIDNENSYILIQHYTIIILALWIVLFLNKYNFLKPSSLYTVLYILLLCISPFLLLLTHYQYKFNILLIISVPILLFSLGTVLSKILTKEKTKTKEIDNNTKKRFNTENFLLFLIFVSFIIWVFYIIKNRTILISGNFENSRISSQQGNGSFLYLIRMWVITIPLLYEYYLKKNEVPKSFYAILILAIAALLLLGGRTPIIIILMNCVLCRFIIEKNKPNQIIKYGIILVLLIGILGFVRNNISGIDSNLTSSFKSIFNNSNYNLTYIFNRFPNTIEYQHGKTYLINIKMLLPGPDLDFTLWLKEALGLQYSGGGVTPTIIGEFYINYGVAGIYFGMFMLGTLFGVLDQKAKQFKSKAYSIFIILQLCLSILGGLANYIIPIILYSLVYLMVNIFTTQEYLVDKKGD